MSSPTPTCENDLLRRRWAIVALWVAPWILIIVAGSLGNNLIRTAAWTLAFSVMGVACLLNARGCGRRHCFYTGPLFLLAALASLLYGLGVLPLGPHGWNWIANVTAAAALLACFGLEAVFGKYTAGLRTKDGRSPH